MSTDSAPDLSTLVEERERFRLLAENASDVVGLGDNEGRITWISESVTDLLGWQPGDLVGRPFTESVHPEDLPVVGRLRQAVMAGEPARGDVRMRTADGGLRWVSIALRSAVDESGAVVGRVAAWRDAQPEHEALERLAESELRFRLLAEHASDVVLQAEGDGTITWTSPSITTVLGWQPDQIVGHRSMEFLHPDDLPAIMDAQGRIAQGETLDFEARVRTSTGEYRWVASRVRSILDDSGALTARVAAWRDIEVEHAAREALRDSEERFRLLAQTTSDVLYRSDLFGIIEWCSDDVVELLGYAPEEVVGRSGEEFVLPDDLTILTTMMSPKGRDSLTWPPLRLVAKDWDDPLGGDHCHRRSRTRRGHRFPRRLARHHQRARRPPIIGEQRGAVPAARGERVGHRVPVRSRPAHPVDLPLGRTGPGVDSRGVGRFGVQ